TPALHVRPPVLVSRRLLALALVRTPSGGEPRTLRCPVRDHIPPRERRRAPWVSVPGCWTRRRATPDVGRRPYRRASLVGQTDRARGSHHSTTARAAVGASRCIAVAAAA